jgi:integrase
MSFRAKGRKYWETKVPQLRDGKVSWGKFPCGTVDSRTAREMDKMIAALGAEGAHAWDILETVTGKPQRWTLSQLFARWTGVPAARNDKDRITAVREQVLDVDLEPLVEKFHTILCGPSGGVKPDTADHYREAVRLFIPEGQPFSRSGLTERELRVWIEEMDDVAPGTVRKRGMGMRRFTRWLRERETINADPMRDIVLPQQGPPLTHYIDVPDAIRLADASAGQMRLFEMLLPGTALEVSVALTLRVRSVSTLDKEIHAPGTKTYTRNRVVRVADFAWPAVLELLKGKHRDSLLFDQIPNRWRARDEHALAAAALVKLGHHVYGEWEGVPKPYTLRDHRHTWAVRAVGSGWPIHAVADQLGHCNGILALKVYGKHAPKKEERDRWEALATLRDEALATERKLRLEM